MCTTATAKRRRKQAKFKNGRKIAKHDRMALKYALQRKK